MICHFCLRRHDRTSVKLIIERYFKIGGFCVTKIYQNGINNVERHLIKSLKFEL